MPNWKKVIISGSDAALNSLVVTNAITSSGLQFPATDGDDGQVITTDGSGNLEFSDINLFARVKNISGTTLQKGTPVHASASASPPSGNVSEIIAASASNAPTMPATFILDETIANGAEGKALLSGYINGVDTSAFSEGDVLYVGENGGFTNIKPTGDSNLIQNLGIVVKSDASNGSGYVYGSGRSNDIPNLPLGKIWVGSSTYSVTSSVLHLDEANERLGIGTTSPQVPLSIKYTDDHTSGTLSLSNSALDIYNDSGSDVAGKGSTITFSDNFLGTSKTTRAAIKGGTDTAGNTADGFLAFYTDSSGGNSMEEVARFNHDGWMGINIDSPRQLLDVDGDMFAQQITAGVWGGDRIVISQRANNDVAIESFASQLFLSSGFNGIAFEGSANTTLMYLNDSGNLGIGTTSPSEKLEVDGDVKINQYIKLDNNSGGVVDSNGNTFIYNSLSLKETRINSNIDDGFISLYSGGNANGGNNERIRIDAAGNLGIGTTSPSHKVEVVGDSEELLKIRRDSGSGTVKLNINSNATGDTGNGILVFSDTTAQSGQIEYEHANDSMRFYTAASEAMRIDSSGNVGIGTTSPGSDLHIKSSTPRLLLEGAVASVENQEISRVSGLWDGTYVADIQFLAGDDTTNKDNGKIAFRTYTSSGVTGIRMLIDETGNVGIGTTSPSEKLHVQGNVLINGAAPYLSIKTTQTGTPDWKIYNSYNSVGDFAIIGGSSISNKFNIQPNGNVGIGTTSPSNKLDVIGNLSATSIRLGSTASGEGIIRYNGGSGNGIGIVTGTLGSSGIGLFVDHSANNRNVGIGTTSPSTKLEVSGNAKASGAIAAFGNDSSGFSGHGMELRVINGVGSILSYNRSTATQMPAEIGGSYLMFDISGAEKMRIDTSGNVGIGNTTPTEKLSVNGNVLADSFITDGGTSSQFVMGDGSLNDYAEPAIVWTSAAGDNTTQGADTWYKVATYNITSDFSGGSWVYHFNSSNAGNVTSAEIAIHLRRNSGVSAYNVDIDCRALTHLNGTAFLEKDSFLLVSNDATDIELWVQKKQNYGVVNATLISERQTNTTITYEPDTNSWTSTTPSGTGDTEQSGAFRFINDGGAGTIDASTVMVVGDSTTNAGLSILGSTTGVSKLNFSDTGDEDVGQIQYDHKNDAMTISVNGGTAMKISASRDTILHGDLILTDGIYNTAISQHSSTTSDVTLLAPASGGIIPVDFTDGSGGSATADGNGDVDLSGLSLGGTSINFFQVQDSSGAGQSLTTAYADVNSSIWSTAVTGSGFSWDGTELTVGTASDAVEFNASIQGITTGNNRVELCVRLMEDTGGGFSEITKVTQYAMRNNNQDEGNVTLVSFYRFNVAAGTKYKIQAKIVGAATTIGTQGGTYFNAKRFS